MTSPPHETDTVQAGTVRGPVRVSRRSQAHALLSAPVGQALLGVVLGLAVTGPAWFGDALLNLDLAVFDRISTTAGFWGMGPELPRRAPAITVLAFVSHLGGDGVLLTAMFMTACVAGAYVGVAQLARRSPLPAALAAGALYALSPWMITRLAVGHLGLAFVAAVLPWVLPTLLRPAESLPRTFLASLALAMGGYFGGTIGAIVVFVGVVGIRWTAAALVTGVWGLAQLPWAAPAIVAAWSSPTVSGGGSFPTDITTVGDFGRLALGFGFWQRGNDIGFDSPLVPVVGLAVVALAVLGAPRLPRAWRQRATILAAVGFVLAAIQEVPMLGSVYRQISDSMPGSVLRESQRVLVLFLVWLAPCAALGIGRLGTVRPSLAKLTALGLAAIALGLAAPALWGVDGRLDAVELERDWEQVRERTEQQPGTVLALPWNQYIDVAAADSRRVYNPVETLISGDVLNASDPEFGDGRREAVDPREPAVDRAVARYDAGAEIAPPLARLGIRWVVLVAGSDEDRWSALADDPGLEPVVEGVTIRLYAVAAWRGAALTSEGEPAAVDPLVRPFVRFEPDATEWFAPSARGWLSGWTSTQGSSRGTIVLAGGSGAVWFWPALLVVGSYAATFAAVVVAVRDIRRSRN